MTVWFMQRLSLISFTVHAVLGCCWHHGHFHQGNCHQEHTTAFNCCSSHIPMEPAEVHPASLGKQHGGDVHGCCDSNHHGAYRHGAPSTTGHFTGQINTAQCLEPTNLNGCSGEHSHTCDETHCSYVPHELKCFQIELVIAFGEFSNVRWNFSEATFSRRKSLNEKESVWTKVASSGDRCADLQSWQI